MSETTEQSEAFETLYLPVSDLEIDRRVQRQGINMAKVKFMVKKYNTGALGIITVSLRKDKSYVVVDGQHRTEATRIKTSNMGTLKCHVFEGLTLAQEAQMFLDLNYTSKVPVIDSFKVKINTDGPEGDVAREIQEIVGAYGFQISRVPANGNINAINVVERIYALSKKLDAEPSLLQATVLVIARSWGNDRHGTQGAIIEGIGRMFAEYGARVDLDRLEEAMKTYAGGPQSLIAEATALAALRKGKVSMGVAELLVEAYNKGRRTKTLEAWRARK